MSFPIPDKALSSHTAVLGMTGSGKTTTAKLIIEHVVAENARVCILDPIKSDWWGLTSSRSGKADGLPFQILGGPRGHVALHSGAGKAVGELVARGSLPLSILDMADFEPGGLQRFFSDFALTLMKRMRGVLYLVMEEAHEFAPKERAGIGNENLAIHYAKKLAVAGRTKGVRLLVLTQRTQSLHNALLGSCETMIAHRFMAPADQDPVLDWLKRKVKDKAEKEAIALTLSELADGEAWVISGAAKILKRMQFPRPWTYDNTKTPDADDDEQRVHMAAVDVEGLREAIGEAVKEAEANDPMRLRARIVELERKLAAAPKPEEKADADKAYKNGYDTGHAHGFGAGVQAVAGQFRDLRAVAEKDIGNRALIMARLEELGRDVAEFVPLILPAWVDPQIAETSRRMEKAAATVVARHAPRVGDRVVGPGIKPGARIVASNTGNGTGKKLSKAERSILTVLAQHPEGRTKIQVAVVTGYSHRAGGFNNALGRLRSGGLIAGRDVIHLVITDAGLDALGPYDPLPSGQALLEHWLRQLSKAERAALVALTAAWPETRSKQEVAAATGYDADGGGFNNALGRLRSLELVSGDRGVLKASDNLFDA